MPRARALEHTGRKHLSDLYRNHTRKIRKLSCNLTSEVSNFGAPDVTMMISCTGASFSLLMKYDECQTGKIESNISQALIAEVAHSIHAPDRSCLHADNAYFCSRVHTALALSMYMFQGLHKYCSSCTDSPAEEYQLLKALNPNYCPQ
jgi:hypothetical protein